MFQNFLQSKPTTMMACCPVPGLSYARTPGTSLITLRFQDPVSMSKGHPQPAAAWTSGVDTSPTTRSKVATKPAASPRAKGTEFKICMTWTMFLMTLLPRQCP